MKLQVHFSMWILILSLLLGSGCTNGNESPTLVLTEVNPTKSLTPQLVFSPTSIPVPTSTSTPLLITPNIVATFPFEQASQKLLDLLANNGNCRLPCLWGITPSKSTFQESQAILTPLSSLSDFTDLFPSPGDISPSYIEGSLVIYNRVVFLYPETGIVAKISFNTEAHRLLEQGGYEDVFDSAFFGEKVAAYSLPHVLSEQGIPSSVRIATYSSPLTRGGTGGFDLVLLYPEEGILVNYTTQMHLIGTIVRGCPANAHVEMELYPSGQSTSFFERLNETDWSVKLNYYKPLQEVTSISPEDFYKIFSQSTNDCIETPAELWPVPEP